MPSLRTMKRVGDQLAPPFVLRRKAMCFGLEAPQEVDLPQLRTQGSRASANASR